MISRWRSISIYSFLHKITVSDTYSYLLCKKTKESETSKSSKRQGLLEMEKEASMTQQHLSCHHLYFLVRREIPPTDYSSSVTDERFGVSWLIYVSSRIKTWTTTESASKRILSCLSFVSSLLFLCVTRDWLNTFSSVSSYLPIINISISRHGSAFFYGIVFHKCTCRDLMLKDKKSRNVRRGNVSLNYVDNCLCSAIVILTSVISMTIELQLQETKVD
jgi:hypothetical protein